MCKRKDNRCPKVRAKRQKKAAQERKRKSLKTQGDPGTRDVNPDGSINTHYNPSRGVYKPRKGIIYATNLWTTAATDAVAKDIEPYPMNKIRALRKQHKEILVTELPVPWLHRNKISTRFWRPPKPSDVLPP